LSYILGIDQGGTKTAAAVIDELGNILGYGLADGAYFPEDGMETAMSCIEHVSEKVFKDTSVSRNQISRIVAGITGVDWPGDPERLAGLLMERFGVQEAEAHNDSVIAFYAGTMKHYGVAVAAGTGINAVIICPDGSQFIFGDYFGSELQGASAIAYRAARKVYDSDLGLLPPTKLTTLYLDYLEESSVFNMLKTYVQNGDEFIKEIAQLTPKIKAIALEGDEVTVKLLDEYADGLCKRVIAGMRKMGMLDIECDVVLAGSVFKDKCNILRDNVINRITAGAPLANIVNAKYESVVGSCIMGLLRQGEFTPEMLINLDSTAQKFELIREVG